MFEKLIKFYLKWTGKPHLISFLDGLLNIGRPGVVLFPVELLEQGLSLVLSGLNNTMATQSNLDWVWPMWLEEQQDPDSRAFIPTGVNLLTANLTHRNWISLGIPESSKESMLDPVGMLTLKPYGWSIFPYIIYNGKRYVPPRIKADTRQHLKNGILPVVITEYQPIEPLGWRSQAMAMAVEGEELVLFTHHLENKGDTPLELTFGLAIRPYNALTMGHIRKLKFKNRLWRVNWEPGVLFFEEPDRVAVSDRHMGDPIFLDNIRSLPASGSSRSGILAGVSEFDVSLQPGEKRSFECMGLLGRILPMPEARFRHVNPESVARATARTETLWNEHVEKGIAVTLPDAELQTAFYGAKNHLHIFDDVSHFSPGTFFYHGQWLRDSAFIALANENMGFSDRVAGKIRGFLKTQTQDGFFRSQNGEWDSQGQAIFTIINHLRTYGKGEPEQWFPSMMKGIRWLEDKHRKSSQVPTPHAGLLPAGFSAEHFGPNDHYFWDNFWGLAGVREMIWLAEKLNYESDRERLEEFFDEYHQSVAECLARASHRTSDGTLPCSPYRAPDSASVGNLIAINPLDLFPPEVDWFRPTVDFLMDNNFRNGLFFQKIIHTGLNPYLSVQLARALLTLDDPRWEYVLRGLLDYGRDTCSWPEAIHPVTGGGCMGDGDHGWATAEFLNLVREMLVREQCESLHLAAGIPDHWYRAGNEIALTNAPGRYGQVSWKMEIGQRELQFHWQIERHEMQDDVPAFLLLPSSWKAEGEVLSHGERKNRIPLMAAEGSLCFSRKDETPGETHFESGRLHQDETLSIESQTLP